MASRQSSWRWLGLLIVLLMIGTLGLRIILELSWVDSLFYSVTTLTTVGFDSPPNLTPEGKIFISIFIIMGIGTVGFVVGKLSENLFVDHLLDAMGKRRLRKLEKMNDHWIICGMGRMGQLVAKLVERDECPFVAIEKDEDKVAELGHPDWLILPGDATQEETLLEAGLERALGIISTLSSDADNVFITLAAKAVNPNLRVIVRGNDGKAASTLYRAGADKVINPMQSGAVALSRAAIRPTVTNFFELVNISRKLDLDFDSIKLAGDSTLAGKALQDTPLRSRHNALVMAIIRNGGKGEAIYNPTGTTVLQPGDQLIVMAKKENIARLRKEIAGTE